MSSDETLVVYRFQCNGEGDRHHYSIESELISSDRQRFKGKAVVLTMLRPREYSSENRMDENSRGLRTVQSPPEPHLLSDLRQGTIDSFSSRTQRFQSVDSRLFALLTTIRWFNI